MSKYGWEEGKGAKYNIFVHFMLQYKYVHVCCVILGTTKNIFQPIFSYNIASVSPEGTKYVLCH